MAIVIQLAKTEKRGKSVEERLTGYFASTLVAGALRTSLHNIETIQVQPLGTDVGITPPAPGAGGFIIPTSGTLALTAASNSGNQPFTALLIGT